MTKIPDIFPEKKTAVLRTPGSQGGLPVPRAIFPETKKIALSMPGSQGESAEILRTFFLQKQQKP